MSLINDALRRASQTEKDRPRQAPTPMGMEPVPVPRGSRLNLVLGAVVLIALLLAGWFFWQWWMARSNVGKTVVTAAAAQPPAAAPPIPQPVVAPLKPAPPPIAPAAPVVVPPVVSPPVAAPTPAPPPPVAKPAPVAWPVDLSVSAIFFSQTNPRAMINGNLYEVGDAIQGIVVKKIEKDKVTVEWEGQSKILMIGE
jgi:hypothetical protein